jgi:hypothetical protein
MATYTPKNVYVYIQAFTGAVAGLLGQSTPLVSSPSGHYTPTMDIAGAWAQEVDIQYNITFGAANPDLFEFEEILNFSDDLFLTSDPQPSTTNVLPATYTKSAQALMAILQDGEAYLAGLGIVVPGFGGECCLTPVVLAAGLAAYQVQPGQDVWCDTPVSHELWSLKAPIIADCPPNAEWGLADGTKGGSFTATEYVTIANPLHIIEDPGNQPVCTTDPILVQNPGETARWQLDPTRTFWKVK